GQAETRRNLSVLGMQDGYLKVHPIVDWNDKHVYDYLTKHDLPYHPLWEQGYLSIGDWHTSAKLTDGMAEEETRFFGLKRECGLHESFDPPPATGTTGSRRSPRVDARALLAGARQRRRRRFERAHDPASRRGRVDDVVDLEVRRHVHGLADLVHARDHLLEGGAAFGRIG